MVLGKSSNQDLRYRWLKRYVANREGLDVV